MRIIGIGLCGPGEAGRYMKATMEEYKRLCDEVLIVTNNATQAEIALIDSYGFSHYEDSREWGKHQPDIKTDLLTKAGERTPDWILALDMDETFAPEFTREEAEKLAAGHEIAYHFMVVNLYNDEDHFAHGAGIQRFWNIRFYKYAPQYGLQFLKKALHCGLAPPVMYGYGWYAPFYLTHRGLMKKEDREKKAQRYDKYDPTAKFKGRVYYDDLRKELKPIPFDRQGLLTKMRAAPDCKPRSPLRLPKELQ